MENNTNISFQNGEDASVTMHVVDTGGEVALKIIQSIIGLIIFVIASPVLIPLLIAESRREQIGDRRRGLLGGE